MHKTRPVYLHKIHVLCTCICVTLCVCVYIYTHRHIHIYSFYVHSERLRDACFSLPRLESRRTCLFARKCRVKKKGRKTIQRSGDRRPNSVCTKPPSRANPWLAPSERCICMRLYTSVCTCAMWVPMYIWTSVCLKVCICILCIYM